MPNGSLCWNCQQPFHDGACPTPSAFEAARREAEKNLRNEAARIEQDLRRFVGFNLSGWRAGEWHVRTPKGTFVSADTREALLAKVRKAAGQAAPAPVQEGFGW